MPAQRKLSAGVAVTRETTDGARFLLLRAYRNWDFPKGLVEPGEDPLDAAIRETREETGIGDLEFAWGTDFIETPPYGGGKIARYYVARTRLETPVLAAHPALGRPEHHEYRWTDLGEALRLTVPRIQAVVTWAAGKIMAEYKTV
ncbi:MAG: NUDIX domain-containing protein [Gammaproteobacteria bacterium]|nr:NUDIX domain-containing protein [Gammaproteobacteria bacterium]